MLGEQAHVLLCTFMSVRDVTLSCAGDLSSLYRTVSPFCLWGSFHAQGKLGCFPVQSVILRNGCCFKTMQYLFLAEGRTHRDTADAGAWGSPVLRPLKKKSKCTRS